MINSEAIENLHPQQAYLECLVFWPSRHLLQEGCAEQTCCYDR